MLVEEMQWPRRLLWLLGGSFYVIVRLLLHQVLPITGVGASYIAVLVTGAAMALIWPFSLLRITIADAELHIRLGWFHEIIPLSTITTCQATTYRWQAWGGFGRHRREGIVLYNLPGDNGEVVELHTQSSQRILFSSRQAAITCNVIHNYQAAQTVNL